MTQTAPGGPLAGIRVLDLAHGRGELAGRLLADLGADVLVIEPPSGNPWRTQPPFDSRDGASLYWAAVALGKRSAVLDLEQRVDRERLMALAREADVLVEAFAPGELARLGLDAATLLAVNPALIYASITPFGQDGPLADAPATDLTIEAAGGLVSLQGDGDRPPIPVGFPQASFHGGAQAAADITIALCERQRSGRGQHLDVSMQAAVVWTLMNATGYPPNTGGDPPGYCEQRAAEPVRVVPGVVFPRTWQCADGWLALSFELGERGWRTLDRTVAWMESEGAVPAALTGRSWKSWVLDVQDGSLSVAQMNELIPAVKAFFLSHTKRQVMDFAVRDDVLVAPIYTTADIANDPQLADRDYWLELAGRKHPGLSARLTRTPISLRSPAPALGSSDPAWAQPRAPLPPPPSPARREQPFAGLKVADFAWVGVGPMISKALADHGATVVRIESSTRPDVLRLVGPFKDNEPGIDRSQFMANFNSSKLGLALDLATPGAREIAHRLVDWADVVVESFTPGTIDRFGFSYEALSRGRPDLLMLSTCLRGQTGPERTYAGFGSQGACLAGLAAITGWPDRPPLGPWGAYTDFVAPRYGIAALASALLHRQRTGEGQHVDLSQVEAAIHFIEPLVLDYTVNGNVAAPAGHDSLYASPHGTFACKGKERYLALAIETDPQWRALAGLVPALAPRARLEGLAARQRCRDAIHAAVAAWLAPQDAFDAAACLRAAGVPASPVLRPSDLYHDPQLAHRGFFVTLEHSVMGPTPYDGPVTHFSATPARLRKAAPCLGEDTATVLDEVLGLSPEAIATYAADGVFI